jgi:branched-chain amino acid transport system permease protein/urea transport system permease protein
VSPLAVTQTLNAVYEVTTLVVIVLGLAVVFGALDVMNLAHGEFIAVGAYTAFACQALGWPYLAAVPAALAVSAVLGLVVERALIRPLYRRPFDTMLATWGLSLLLRRAIELLFGGGYKSLVVPVRGSVSILGEPYPAYRLLLIALCVTGVTALLVWYRRSPAGARLRAMVGNPELAQAVGIRTGRLARNTFVTGTCLAGLAGVMVAPLTAVQPSMGLDYILKAFFVIVAGGLGSAPGLVGGAALIGGVESAISTLADRTWGYSTVLAIAIIFLWLRPRGIFARS